MKVIYTGVSGQINAFDVTGAFYSIVPRGDDRGSLLRVEVGDRLFHPMPTSKIYTKEQCLAEIIRIVESEAGGASYMIVSDDPLFQSAVKIIKANL